MFRRTKQRVPRAAGAAASALLLVACGAGQPTGADDRKPCVVATTGETPEPFQGPIYDYDPRRSPDELAQLSQLVVSGTISAVREGRTMVYPANAPGIEGPTTIVLVITDVTAVSGQQQAGNDGSVYLELQGAKLPDPVNYSRALPAGARVAAYLVPAGEGTPDERTDVAIANPAAGRPAGQALYLPAGPQGLAIQAQGNVVWPLIGAQAPGCIEDALPGGHLIGQ
ncbi:hypothetical protein QFZ79_003638 [Arthrobacter sp. V4I6]|uniref:hypothetical protein n=1 Tax=unclassified Arthrobacter TaxID=235627 RepID=UPI0027828DD9|nr:MULTISPECIES: hypothetical protein [unclassified Arthrobacter]MDQ0821264.1 hypothetical protein [Arthrobacter sp. V1I7]MDQ0855527.1 hypothetical protein [Arthrobacter sp. V4I6]